jgi:23S rRNA pseudouridine1911/1915/1917 synthase
MKILPDPYIIYENNEYILLYKPPGWSCNTEINNRLYKEYPINNKFIILFIKFILKTNYTKNKFRSGLMNRLDIETSGAVIVVKNKIGFDKMLNIVHKQKNICKIYLCLANNNFIKKKLHIEKGIECNRDKTIKYMKSYCYPTNKDNKKYYANSFFYKIKNLVDNENNDYTLFFVRIFTGKTHQIRVHMNSIGHPLVADPQYLDKDTYKKNIELVPRCFLHNIYYEFKYDNELKKFIIPVPDDLLECLNKLKSKTKYDIYKIPDELILLK